MVLHLQQAQKVKLIMANYHSFNIYYASLGLNNYIKSCVILEQIIKNTGRSLPLNTSLTHLRNYNHVRA